MTRYLRALKNLRNHRSGRICIGYCKDESIQRVWSDYAKLRISIPEFKGVTMLDYELWDLDIFDSKVMEAINIANRSMIRK
jgi:hypothetical protein